MNYKEIFLKKLKEKHKNEYELIGDYKNIHTPTKFKHNKCGEIIEIKPRTLFINKKICYICESGHSLNEKQFMQKLKYYHGNDYIPTENFEKLIKPMEFVHRGCGLNFKTEPHFLFKENRKKGFCPICHGLPKNTRIFKYEIKSLYGDAYELSGEYNDATTNTSFIHKKCGFEFIKTPVDFIKGKMKCPVCDGVKKQKTNEIFKLQIKQQVGNEYIFTEEYKDTFSKLNCIHRKCGTNFKVSPTKFLNRKQRCPKCTEEKIKNKFKKGLQQFKKEVYLIKGSEYTVTSKKYINNKTSIKVRHNSKKCNHFEFKVQPYNFLNNNMTHCPICNEEKGGGVTTSKAMKSIEKIFSKENINFIKENEFEDLVYKKSLRFDYAIFNEKGNFLLLLEYDGVQHYKPIKFFGGIDKFIGRSIKDSLKNTYCKENKIKLIRISFENKKKIKKIIYGILEKYNLIKGGKTKSA